MISALLKAARPVTLGASVAPVMVGTAVAIEQSKTFRADIFFLILCSAVLLQAASNYLNDALDFKKGADTHQRLGPVRISQAGLLKSSTVYYAGIVCLTAALLCGIPLVMLGGFPILLIGLTSILFAYAYSGGPYPLAYNGFGEIFAMCYYGIIAVAGTTYLHLGAAIPTESWFRGVQVGCFATALIALNNFRDTQEDRLSGKRTLAVRFGLTFGKAVIMAALCMPLGIEIFMHTKYSYWIMLSLLYPIWLAVAVAKVTPSKECNMFLGKISKAELLFAFFCTGAALLSLQSY